MERNLKIISFSSPKGGVGRTLTLTNCAKIYSTGVPWAGIASSNVILADFDFYAPGIHFYNFSGKDGDKGYEIGGKELTFDTMLKVLDSQEIGLLFYLSKIIENPSYTYLCRKVIRKFKNKQSDNDTLVFYQNECLKILSEEEFSPKKHLIKIPDKSIFILPAGSPNNKLFDKRVFDFNWNAFINNFLGLDLLDCIFYKIRIEILNKEKPVRILLDQQGGSSIASAINKTLADAHVLVSGFNEQNKSGLKSLIDSHQTNFNDITPWVVLNQYKFRNKALEYTTTEDKRNLSPHQVFKEDDKTHRLDYIDSLNIDPTRIFVTEFVSEAIQSEYFYLSNNVSIGELQRLLVNIEKEFLPSSKNEVKNISSTNDTIVYLGEEVVFDTKRSGAHNAIFKLLKLYFPNCRIIGLSACHKDIVTIANSGELKSYITDNTGKKIHTDSFRDIEEGFYKVSHSSSGNCTLKLPKLDFICYPYHLERTLTNSGKIKRIEENEFEGKCIIEESLKCISSDYYTNNILQWKKYCTTQNKIIGVPLFLDFQLLVYHKRLFTQKSDFSFLFKKFANRNFEGFKNPQDILDFAGLAKKKEGDLKQFTMFHNPDIYELWYEWLTIFSIFYYDNEMPAVVSNYDNLSDLSIFKFFLLEENSLDAMLHYLELYSHSSTQTLQAEDENKIDWNKVLEDFYNPLNKASNSLILMWPDTVPTQYNIDDDYIYQAPPAFKIFEECWLMSIVDSSTDKRIPIQEKIDFFTYYLSIEGQTKYLENGGLPVNKFVLSSLDSWRNYPFIPPLCNVYLNEKSESELVKSWQEISIIIGRFYDFLTDIRTRNVTKEELIQAIHEWN